MDIKKQLYQWQDLKYQKFSCTLIPGLDNAIGVRVPLLRKFAKELVKSNYALDAIELDTYEEILLKGFMIGYSKISLDLRLRYIEEYIPYISNWAICDMFVSTLKFTKENKDIVYAWMMKYLGGSVYEVRFVLVMLLTYFMDDDYIEKCYKVFDSIHNDDYYLNMALSWAISVAYVHFPERTLQYLDNSHLDLWVYHKAITKMIESNRVSVDEKEMLRKRRNGVVV